MKRRRGPPLFLNDEHRRDYDSLIEKCSDARIWMRKQSRRPRERAPEIPPAIVQHFPAPRQLMAV